MNDITREKTKRLCRDLWIILAIQVVSLLAMAVFMHLIGFNFWDRMDRWESRFIPNQPQWDDVYLLVLRIVAFFHIACFVAAWWTGFKLINRLLPIGIRLYGISLWVLNIFFLMAFGGFELFPDFGPWLFVIFPFYTTIPLYLICCWLMVKNRKET